jgi:nicotinate-nucleotide pyrophosphorylase (carboxylating)
VSDEATLARNAFSPADALRFPLSEAECARLVRDALAEDRAEQDVTTLATVPADARARADLVARRNGVICGIPLAVEAFRQCDPDVVIRVDGADGRPVDKGATVIALEGSARALLSAERVALNFMQHLSGIATLTAQYVNAVRGTRAQIIDTRKTLPGWRVLEKYAVRCGGGRNHRSDLSQAVLIKDNHLAAVGGDVHHAVSQARALAPGALVEVECDDVAQVTPALEAGADIIMLDNMGLQDMRDAVELVAGRAVIEASGGVNLQTVRGIAETGVDWISVGALTHSPAALDLALDFEE